MFFLLTHLFLEAQNLINTLLHYIGNAAATIILLYRGFCFFFIGEEEKEEVTP